MDPRNPKDIIGVNKVPLGLLPGVAKIKAALVMRHGAEKYGPYNWRESEIILSVYLDAIERHLLATRDGEWTDPDSNLPHVAHIIAGAAVILDAEDLGKLVNDLPSKGGGSGALLRYREVKNENNT